jgi:hypothetical protein
MGRKGQWIAAKGVLVQVRLKGVRIFHDDEKTEGTEK